MTSACLRDQVVRYSVRRGSLLQAYLHKWAVNDKARRVGGPHSNLRYKLQA